MKGCNISLQQSCNYVFYRIYFLIIPLLTVNPPFLQFYILDYKIIINSYFFIMICRVFIRQNIEWPNQFFSIFCIQDF